MQRRTFLAAAAPAIHDWARLPLSLALGNTHGICEDAQGHLYVAHTVHRSSQARDALLIFDEKGKLVRRWGSEFQGGTHGLHLAREGRDEFLYLVDTGKGRQSGIDPTHTWMVKMTLRGEEVFRIGYPKESPHYKLDKDGRPATKFSPTNIALAPNGDIYVADGYGSYFINQYDAKGAFLRSFGGPGTAAGQLASPHGLILDRRGASPSLLVADRSNHRLQRFTLDGRHLAFHTGACSAPATRSSPTSAKTPPAIGWTSANALAPSSPPASSSPRTAPAATMPATSSSSNGSRSAGIPNSANSAASPLSVQLFNGCRLERPLVHHHAVPQPQLLARRQGVAAVRPLSLAEAPGRKRIGRA